MRRTKEQAAQTGRQILRTAENLFLEQGYDKVSLEDIATAAGVTRGAVHWHFKNKQGLLYALLDDAQAPFRALAQNLAEDSEPASLEKLGEIIGGTFDRLHDDPRQQGLVKAMMRLDLTLADDDGAGSTFRSEMNLHLEQIFAVMAARRGLPAPWTPASAAAALGATVGGLISEWALGKGNFRLVPDGKAFVKIILATWLA